MVVLLIFFYFYQFFFVIFLLIFFVFIANKIKINFNSPIICNKNSFTIIFFSNSFFIFISIVFKPNTFFKRNIIFPFYIIVILTIIFFIISNFLNSMITNTLCDLFVNNIFNKNNLAIFIFNRKIFKTIFLSLKFSSDLFY